MLPGFGIHSCGGKDPTGPAYSANDPRVRARVRLRVRGEVRENNGVVEG